MSVRPQERQVREDVWKTAETRAAKIGWQDLANARLIAASDVDLMIKFQREPIQAQAAHVVEDHLAYAEVFMTLLRNVSSRVDCTHYVLTALDEMMNENDRVALIFERILVHPSLRPFAVLADLLRAQSSVREVDELVVARSCNILAHLLQGGLIAPQEDASVLLQWAVSDLEKGGGGGSGSRKKAVQQAVVGLVAALLRDQTARVEFARRNGVQLLASILAAPNPNQNLQLLYVTLTCYWMLSYNAEIAPRLADSALLKSMLALVKNVMKEKVIRMVLATWHNLMSTSECKGLLVDIGAVKVLQALKTRNFSDEDVMEDVNFIITALEGVIQTKSTFDEYRKEVMSGEFEWSPVHRSVKFWEANYLKLTEKDNLLLVTLVNALKPNSGLSAESVAIAAHDLGEFVRFHPGGKAILEKMGMKPLIMALLTNNDEQIRKEALLCVQKLMVN